MVTKRLTLTMQEIKPDSEGYTGIAGYNDDQLKFHMDVMLLLTSKKHQRLGMDDAMVVFGRIYAVYVYAQMMKEKGKKK